MRHRRRNLTGTTSSLVILDIGLPGPDGLFLARWLRVGDDLPILILTAHDGLHARLAGLAVGADA